MSSRLKLGVIVTPLAGFMRQGKRVMTQNISKKNLLLIVNQCAHDA